MMTINSQTYLKQRDVVVMRDANVVRGMRYHAAHFYLLSVVGVRAAPCDAQLNGPAIYVRVASMKRIGLLLLLIFEMK